MGFARCDPAGNVLRGLDLENVDDLLQKEAERGRGRERRREGERKGRGEEKKREKEKKKKEIIRRPALGGTREMQ